MVSGFLAKATAIQKKLFYSSRYNTKALRVDNLLRYMKPDTLKITKVLIAEVVELVDTQP